MDRYSKISGSIPSFMIKLQVLIGKLSDVCGRLVLSNSVTNEYIKLSVNLNILNRSEYDVFF